MFQRPYNCCGPSVALDIQFCAVRRVQQQRSTDETILPGLIGEVLEGSVELQTRKGGFLGAILSYFNGEALSMLCMVLIAHGSGLRRGAVPKKYPNMQRGD